MEIVTDYTPASERGQDPSLQQNYYDQARRLPWTNIYQKIIIDNVIHRGEPYMTPEEAVQSFLSVREARHDLWHTFIIENTDPDRWTDLTRITKVEQFVHEVLQEDRESSNIPISIVNKTPDLLYKHRGSNVIFLGDVTVTNSVDMARARKYEKYQEVERYLMSLNYIVKHVDFILQKDGRNLYGELNNLSLHGLIRHEIDASIPRRFLEVANNIMDEIRNKCTNPKLYDEVLAANDKNLEHNNAYEIPEFITDIELEDYIPHNSEHELMRQLRDRTNEVILDDYFDTDVNSSIKAFETIIENNKENVNKILPKSTIKVVDNSHLHEEKNNHDLIKDYIEDIMTNDPSDIRNYVLDMMPRRNQLKLMKRIYDSKIKPPEIKEDLKDEYKVAGVGGGFQYTRYKTGESPQTINMEYQLLKGKKISNSKNAPECIDMDKLNMFYDDMVMTFNYYGNISNKKSFLDDSWDASTIMEKSSTKYEKEVYDYVRNTCGAQLCHSMGQLYNRITHMSCYQGRFDNIFVPPNGSFITIMPKAHTIATSKNCEMPFIFITRTPINQPLYHIEYEHMLSTENYIYYIGQLCRLNVNKIACWADSGYKLITSASYILSYAPKLYEVKEQVVGMLTMLSLDVHQKTSEYLDLLKYISFMPFADLHRLPKLIESKCDLLMKTKFDAFHLLRLKDYVIKLSDIESLDAKKPVITTFNATVMKESLGIKMSLPSFFNTSVRHDKPEQFIEEISIIYCSRPKHLYGNQFMDTAMTNLAIWNNEYLDEVERYGGWATNGVGEGDFPFDAKYCYSSDAIYYAEKCIDKEYSIDSNRVNRSMYKSTYGKFMHNNCSLRGCVKDIDRRLGPMDIHTTSIDECLKYYKSKEYDDRHCRASAVAIEFIKSDRRMQFSMSAKDQRGSGRPIATPDLGTKAALMMIEKPEAAKGAFVGNNIIVAGKKKLREQHETYTNALSVGIREGLLYVYQLTEDQSKYSENDNPRKYETYIRVNKSLDRNTKLIQIAALRKLYDRDHLMHELPTKVEDDPLLYRYVVRDEKSLGIRAIIGWPQGMLNDISTSVHSACDLWIYRLYRMAYPNDEIYAKGLVHSDDSWVVVLCNDVNVFKRFAYFRKEAKKMFALKLNEKKLWGSKYMGELVSNYNLNGAVHLSTGKVISNGVGGLTFQNWPMDVSNQISTMQQALKSGASLGTITLLSTVLRQQMTNTYNITGFQKENLHKLPIDIGGYPDNSPYELAITGSHCHYLKLLDNYKRDDKSECCRIVKAALGISWEINKDNWPAGDFTEGEITGNDYENVTVPSKGDIFSSIKHIMPRSTKISKTLKTIDELKGIFQPTGLSMIITDPSTLAEALGDLADRTRGKMYELASEKFTQNMRRLAISQALQARGKVVRIKEGPALTFNELYDYLINIKMGQNIPTSIIETAFSSDDELVICARNSVYQSEIVPIEEKRTRVINYMPEISNKFYTISDFKDVLLYIVDRKKGTEYYHKYGRKNTSISTVNSDSNMIEFRFENLFSFNTVEQTVNCLMQMKLNANKSRDFVQPRIDNKDLPTFVESLYGNILSKDRIHKVHANRTTRDIRNVNADKIQSIYCCEVINSLYQGNFQLSKIDGISVVESINGIDYSTLSRNDFLKLGIMQMLVCQNREHLDKYMETETFRVNWIIPQKYSRSGFYGDYYAEFKSDDIDGQISCSAGNVTMRVNTIRVNKILAAMRKFTLSGFSKDYYHFDGAWGTKDIWNYDSHLQQYEDQLARNDRKRNDGTSILYLCYNGPFSTTISQVPSGKFIKIIYDTKIRYSLDITYTRPDFYEFSPSLRVITNCYNGIVDNEVKRRDSKTQRVTIHKTREKTRKFRSANVYQNFSIPMRNKMLLLPSHIGNILNNSLLQTGIMEDVMLGRPIDASRATIKEVLIGSTGENPSGPFFNCFINLFSKIHRTPNIMPIDEVKEEVVTFDMETPMGMEIADAFMTTNIESLENYDMSYLSEVVVGQKKLCMIKNIERTLCKYYSGMSSESSKNLFIYKILTSSKMKQMMNNIDEDLVRDLIDVFRDIGLSGEVDYELHAFIYGNELDLASTWRNVNRSVLNQSEHGVRNPTIERLVESFNRAVDSVLLENDEYSPIRELIDEIE